jgi:hypothetical protein
MPNVQDSGPLHPERTRRSGFQYFFYDKHHRVGYSEDAQWRPDMTHDEEFGVFDLVDWHEISGDNDHLYGLRLGPEDAIMTLGTREEQVAKFPAPQDGRAWHGYPAWPIMRLDRDKQERKYPAPRGALAKMKEAGLITEKQRKRLAGGKQA